MSVQVHSARNLARFSLAIAAMGALAFVIGQSFLWDRPTLFAYENVMDTGAVFMAISAILGIAAFIRRGDGGVNRPVLVKWTFGLSVLLVVLLTALLISMLGIPPLA